MDGLLSLASHLIRQTDVRSFFLSFVSLLAALVNVPYKYILLAYSLFSFEHLFDKLFGLKLSVCQCASLFRKVMTNSVGRLFRVHTQLAAQGWSPPMLLIFITVLNV